MGRRRQTLCENGSCRSRLQQDIRQGIEKRRRKDREREREREREKEKARERERERERKTEIIVYQIFLFEPLSSFSGDVFNWNSLKLF